MDMNSIQVQQLYSSTGATATVQQHWIRTHKSRRRGKEFGTPQAAGREPVMALWLTSSQFSAGRALGLPHDSGRLPPRLLFATSSMASCGSMPAAPQLAGSCPCSRLPDTSSSRRRPMAAQVSGKLPLMLLFWRWLQSRREGRGNEWDKGEPKRRPVCRA